MKIITDTTIQNVRSWGKGFPDGKNELHIYFFFGGGGLRQRILSTNFDIENDSLGASGWSWEGTLPMEGVHRDISYIDTVYYL